MAGRSTHKSSWTKPFQAIKHALNKPSGQQKWNGHEDNKEHSNFKVQNTETSFNTSQHLPNVGMKLDPISASCTTGPALPPEHRRMIPHPHNQMSPTDVTQSLLKARDSIDDMPCSVPRVASTTPTEGLSFRAQQVFSMSHGQGRATTNIASGKTFSRIPTPSRPPNNDLYSHDVYGREGRRSVLSPSHRDCAEPWWKLENDNQEDLYHTNHRCRSRSQSSWYMVPSRQSLMRTKIPVSNIHSSKPGRAQSSALAAVSSRPTTQISNPVNKGEIGDNPNGGRHQGRSDRNTQPVVDPNFYRKVRMGDDTDYPHAVPVPNPSPPQRLAEGEKRAFSDSPHLRAPRDRHNKMHPLKQICWTNRLEKSKLQNQENERTTNTAAHAIQSKAQPQSQGLPRPRASQGNVRFRDRMKKMVTPESQEQPTRIPHSTPTSTSHYQIQRSTLTPEDENVSQVTEPQPRQYWLGRLVTLTNAFHHEDSFHEPDVATGFGMLSSYSRPLGRADSEANVANYRVKRAFMVLENVCVTEAASESLREFRNEYVRLHGDRWMR